MLERVNRRFSPLSDLEIEQYLCGELDNAARKRIESQIQAQSELRAYIEQRRQNQARFFAEHPTFEMESKQAASFLPLGFGFWLPKLVAVCSVLLLVVVTFWLWPSQNARRLASIRARGSVKIGLTVKRGGRTFVYRDGVLLRAGDRVRLSVESPTGGYLSVISVSARGEYNVYYSGLEVHPGSYTVPDSLLLDDSTNKEKWVVLLTPEKVEPDSLIQQLKQDKPLRADGSILLIEKEAAP